MVSAAYIHIPFCTQICHYCDFTKFFYNEKLVDDYLLALNKEMTTYVTSRKKVNTIFVGGGTPTALSASQLEKLLITINDVFETSTCKEFTFEANPGDLTEEKIKVLKHYGVNRISLGVQVFDDEMLEKIGRVHRIKDVYTTVDLLKYYDFQNISLDLIYGLPDQTLDHFITTLEEALAFNLPHYSAYSLQIEPKTVFYQRHLKGKLKKPVEDEEAKMFEHLVKRMNESGINQYEVSNFAKTGFESLHNLTYWNNDYYYGFGAGAHGYLPGRRIVNIRPLPKYIKQAHEDGKPILQEELITSKEEMEEYMFLGLRKKEGISKKIFQEKFGTYIEQIYGDVIKDLVGKGWIEENEDFLYLTEEGTLLGNNVFQAFLLEESQKVTK